jgi:hypothetical protein
LKTLDLINQLLKPFVNNYKNRKEKVWEFNNMQEKNTTNMKKI